MGHFLRYLSWDVMVTIRILLIFDIIRDNLTLYIWFIFLLSILMKEKLVLYNICDITRWSYILKECSAQRHSCNRVFSQILDCSRVFVNINDQLVLALVHDCNWVFSKIIDCGRVFASIHDKLVFALVLDCSQVFSHILDCSRVFTNINDQLVFALVLSCSRVFSQILDCSRVFWQSSIYKHTWPTGIFIDTRLYLSICMHTWLDYICLGTRLESGIFIDKGLWSSI